MSELMPQEIKRLQAEIDGLYGALAQANAEVARLTRALTWEQNHLSRVGTHGPGCHTWGPGHYQCLMSELARVQSQCDEWKKNALAKEVTR